MIEIELKLEVREFPTLKDAKLKNEKRVLDIYYDTKDYSLLKGGNFLRNRNNKKLDFKLNVGDLSHLYCKETSFDIDALKSSEDMKAVFDSINVPYSDKYNDFESFLKANNLEVLATIDKERKTYILDDLIVSFDEAKDIGNFVEIELDVDDSAVIDKEEITKYMLDKLTKLSNLKEYERVNIGYVELYLKRHNPYAYNLGLYKD